MAALPPQGIGEILGAAFRLYQRYRRTLVAIAAVDVVKPRQTGAEDGR
jgi:hypothetical protein